MHSRGDWLVCRASDRDVQRVVVTSDHGRRRGAPTGVTERNQGAPVNVLICGLSDSCSVVLFFSMTFSSWPSRSGWCRKWLCCAQRIRYALAVGAGSET